MSNAATLTMPQRQRLHPHKLMMGMAMGSMFMVFAGLTSAFLLQSKNENGIIQGSSKEIVTKIGDFTTIHLPWQFWISTLVILLSSYTMHKAKNAFAQRDRQSFKKNVGATTLLGLLFIAMQVWGFYLLFTTGTTLQSSANSGFLYIIAGLHATHIAAAIIALIIVYLVAFRKSTKVYSNTSVEVMAWFWHFVDGLWVYLFIFFCINFNL